MKLKKCFEHAAALNEEEEAEVMGCYIEKKGPAWTKSSKPVAFTILNQTAWNTTCWESLPPLQPGKMPACPENFQTITSSPPSLSRSPCRVVI